MYMQLAMIAVLSHKEVIDSAFRVVFLCSQFESSVLSGASALAKDSAVAGETSLHFDMHDPAQSAFTLNRGVKSTQLNVKSGANRKVDVKMAQKVTSPSQRSANVTSSSKPLANVTSSSKPSANVSVGVKQSASAVKFKADQGQSLPHHTYLYIVCDV